MTTIAVETYPEQELYFETLAANLHKAQCEYARKSYEMAYRLFRQYKGNAAVRDNKYTLAAWKTYTQHDPVYYRCEDPILTIDHKTIGKVYPASHKQYIRNLYHFNTDFTFSEVSK